MSKTGLYCFEGKWKESESKNDSDFLKAIGVGKSKRRIAKRIKSKIKYEIHNDTSYTFSNKTLRTSEKGQVGKSSRVKTNLGEADVLAKLEGNELHTEMVIRKAEESMKLKDGDKVLSRSFINGKGNLESHVTFNGATMVKIFKPKQGEDDDEEDAEDQKALAEMRSAANDDE